MSDLLTKLDGKMIHCTTVKIHNGGSLRDQLKSDLEAHSPSDSSENNKIIRGLMMADTEVSLLDKVPHMKLTCT